MHLVAIIRGRPADFQRVMVDGFRNVLAAAHEAGVERLVLMSALGTGEATKDTVPYFAAKWQMEHDLRASGLEHVIFRPSFVFGRDGGALPTFIRQVKLSPVVTVIGKGRQRSQPIWVDDVAAYFARRGRAAGGRQPDVRARRARRRDLERALPADREGAREAPAARSRPGRPRPAGARLTERLPGSPLSVDQVAMLEGPDNVVSSPEAVETFNLPLVPLDEQIRRAA